MAAESLAGRLVVATAAIVGPTFHLTAMLILRHSADGAVGVVLNRPSELAVAEVAPRWQDGVSAPAVVFLGGPVQAGSMIALARRGGRAPRAWHRLVGSIGLVDLDKDPAGVLPALDGLRLFAGCAGWSAGQLEAEIASGAWFIADAEPDDAFSTQPEQLWIRVLRRQGGCFTTIPADPSLN